MADPGANRWTHPSAIMVATDLEDLDRLMPFAVEQALNSGSQLILMHVVATSQAVAVDAAGMPYYDPTSVVEFAAKTLESWCEKARNQKVKCDAVVREGPAAQQVLAAVRQFKADRILLGTRSRGKISKLLLGSVAEQVLRSVNLPVMTVGPEAHLPASDTAERVVLHATSLREASRPGAALACQIAATLNAKLVLLYVLPPMDDINRKGLPTGLDSACLQELKALAAETQSGCTTPIEPLVLHGNPAIEILAEAAGRQASLIVMGATQRLVFENLTRDRTIYKVLAHARCPVLTLRETPGKQDEDLVPRLAMHS